MSVLRVAREDRALEAAVVLVVLAVALTVGWAIRADYLYGRPCLKSHAETRHEDDRVVIEPDHDGNPSVHVEPGYDYQAEVCDVYGPSRAERRALGRAD